MLSLEKVTFFCRSFFESGYTFDHKAALNGNILSDMWNKSLIRYIDKATENVVSYMYKCMWKNLFCQIY